MTRVAGQFLRKLASRCVGIVFPNLPFKIVLFFFEWYI